MSNSDIEAQVAAALAGIRATEGEEDQKNDNPSIWIGNRLQARPDGGSMIERDVMTKTDMQQKVLSQGARRLPSYFDLAGKLVKSNFMSRSSTKYPGGVASGLGNAIDVYQAYAQDGGTMNFTQWLDWYSGSSEEVGDGTGGGGGGVSTGPRETVTMASERDLRAAVDAMAAQVLGRAATDDEFQNALKQVRSAEQAEPTITTTGVGRTVSQSGLSAEGRSSIIRDTLMQGPEAEDFGKATKMMDLFYSALEARPSGA